MKVTVVIGFNPHQTWMKHRQNGRTPLQGNRCETILHLLAKAAPSKLVTFINLRNGWEVAVASICYIGRISIKTSTSSTHCCWYGNGGTSIQSQVWDVPVRSHPPRRPWQVGYEVVGLRCFTSKSAIFFFHVWKRSARSFGLVMTTPVSGWIASADNVVIVRQNILSFGDVIIRAITEVFQIIKFSGTSS